MTCVSLSQQKRVKLAKPGGIGTFRLAARQKGTRSGQAWLDNDNLSLIIRAHLFESIQHCLPSAFGYMPIVPH
jgi:hypothetical protein